MLAELWGQTHRDKQCTGARNAQGQYGQCTGAIWAMHRGNMGNAQVGRTWLREDRGSE